MQLASQHNLPNTSTDAHTIIQAREEKKNSVNNKAGETIEGYVFRNYVAIGIRIR